MTDSERLFVLEDADWGFHFLETPEASEVLEWMVSRRMEDPVAQVMHYRGVMRTGIFGTEVFLIIDRDLEAYASLICEWATRESFECAPELDFGELGFPNAFLVDLALKEGRADVHEWAAARLPARAFARLKRCWTTD